VGEKEEREAKVEMDFELGPWLDAARIIVPSLLVVYILVFS
jgi:hypothetical protein